MDIQIVILSEVSQKEKGTYYLILFIHGLKQQKKMKVQMNLFTEQE